MKQSTEQFYKSIERIKDDRFNIDLMEQYCLSLQIGLNDCQVGVIDVVRNRCLLTEDYVFHNANSAQELTTSLSVLFNEHHVLEAGFWGSVKVSLKNQYFTLIPESHFDEIEVPTYLKFAAGVDPEEFEIFYNKLNSSPAYIVFAAERELTNWIRAKYSTVNIQFLHQGQALTEGIFNNRTLKRETALYAFIGKDHLNVFVSNNGVLNFYNRFLIASSEDITKFILMVIKTLNLSPGKLPVFLWGDINRKSPAYKDLYQYVLNLSFGKKPSYLIFGYMFDQTEDHKYFDLYSTNLC